MLHFKAWGCVHGGVKTFDTSAGIALTAAACFFFFTALQAHTSPHCWEQIDSTQTQTTTSFTAELTASVRSITKKAFWAQQGQSISAGKSAKFAGSQPKGLKNSPCFISPQNTPPFVKDSCSSQEVERPDKRGVTGFNTLVALYGIAKESGCTGLCFGTPSALPQLASLQGCPCVLLSHSDTHENTHGNLQSALSLIREGRLCSLLSLM